MKTLGSCSPRKIQHNHRGFTLVELLLVLAILALLAGIVLPRITHRFPETQVRATTTQMAAFKSAFELFEVDNGYLPKGQNALQELVTKPRDAQGWRGPYMETIPLDPWKHAYIYECPGKHRPASFDLMSVGPDGQPGTADDITNWK
jgi:general secretion pathway protein G